MSQFNILPTTYVLSPLTCFSKKRLFEEICSVAAAVTGLDSVRFLRALNEREWAGSTVCAKGVGLPHAVIPELSQSLSILAILQAEVPYNTVDSDYCGVDVALAFFISPKEKHDDYENRLRLISQELENADLVNSLRRSWQDNSKLLLILGKLDQLLSAEIKAPDTASVEDEAPSAASSIIQFISDAINSISGDRDVDEERSNKLRDQLQSAASKASTSKEAPAPAASQATSAAATSTAHTTSSGTATATKPRRPVDDTADVAIAKAIAATNPVFNPSALDLTGIAHDTSTAAASAAAPAAATSSTAAAAATAEIQQSAEAAAEAMHEIEKSPESGDNAIFMGINSIEAAKPNKDNPSLISSIVQAISSAMHGKDREEQIEQKREQMQRAIKLSEGDYGREAAPAGASVGAKTDAKAQAQATTPAPVDGVAASAATTAAAGTTSTTSKKAGARVGVPEKYTRKVAKPAIAGSRSLLERFASPSATDTIRSFITDTFSSTLSGDEQNKAKETFPAEAFARVDDVPLTPPEAAPQQEHSDLASSSPLSAALDESYVENTGSAARDRVGQNSPYPYRVHPSQEIEPEVALSTSTDQAGTSIAAPTTSEQGQASTASLIPEATAPAPQGTSTHEALNLPDATEATQAVPVDGRAPVAAPAPEAMAEEQSVASVPADSASMAMDTTTATTSVLESVAPLDLSTQLAADGAQAIAATATITDTAEDAAAIEAESAPVVHTDMTPSAIRAITNDSMLSQDGPRDGFSGYMQVRAEDVEEESADTTDAKDEKSVAVAAVSAILNQLTSVITNVMGPDKDEKEDKAESADSAAAAGQEAEASATTTVDVATAVPSAEPELSVAGSGEIPVNTDDSATISAAEEEANTAAAVSTTESTESAAQARAEAYLVASQEGEVAADSEGATTATGEEEHEEKKSKDFWDKIVEIVTPQNKQEDATDHGPAESTEVDEAAAPVDPEAEARAAAFAQAAALAAIGPRNPNLSVEDILGDELTDEQGANESQSTHDTTEGTTPSSEHSAVSAQSTEAAAQEHPANHEVTALSLDEVLAHEPSGSSGELDSQESHSVSITENTTPYSYAPVEEQAESLTTSSENTHTDAFATDEAQESHSVSITENTTTDSDASEGATITESTEDNAESHGAPDGLEPVVAEQVASAEVTALSLDEVLAHEPSGGSSGVLDSQESHSVSITENTTPDSNAPEVASSTEGTEVSAEMSENHESSESVAVEQVAPAEVTALSLDEVLAHEPSGSGGELDSQESHSVSIPENTTPDSHTPEAVTTTESTDGSAEGLEVSESSESVATEQVAPAEVTALSLDEVLAHEPSGSSGELDSQESHSVSIPENTTPYSHAPEVATTTESTADSAEVYDGTEGSEAVASEQVAPAEVTALSLDEVLAHEPSGGSSGELDSEESHSVSIPENTTPDSHAPEVATTTESTADSAEVYDGTEGSEAVASEQVAPAEVTALSLDEVLAHEPSGGSSGELDSQESHSVSISENTTPDSIAPEVATTVESTEGDAESNGASESSEPVAAEQAAPAEVTALSLDEVLAHEPSGGSSGELDSEESHSVSIAENTTPDSAAPDGDVAGAASGEYQVSAAKPQRGHGSLTADLEAQLFVHKLPVLDPLSFADLLAAEKEVSDLTPVPAAAAAASASGLEDSGAVRDMDADIELTVDDVLGHKGSEDGAGGLEIEALPESMPDYELGFSPEAVAAEAAEATAWQEHRSALGGHRAESSAGSESSLRAAAPTEDGSLSGTTSSEPERAEPKIELTVDDVLELEAEQAAGAGAAPDGAAGHDDVAATAAQEREP